MNFNKLVYITGLAIGITGAVSHILGATDTQSTYLFVVGIFLVVQAIYQKL